MPRPPRMMVEGKYRCTTCDLWKPPDMFPIAATLCGRSSMCYACRRVYQKPYNLTAKEKRQEAKVAELHALEAWKFADMKRDQVEQGFKTHFTPAEIKMLHWSIPEVHKHLVIVDLDTPDAT